MIANNSPAMLPRIAVMLVCFCASSTGCKTSQEAGPPNPETAGSGPGLQAASTNTTEPQSPIANAVAPSASTNTPAEPSAQPSAEPSAAPDSPPPAAPPAPLPSVQVKNIGMHIGGGPNDQVSKQPIADSVKPHFDALRACWSYVDDPSKPGDFGVDLLIPHEGGKAEVSHPRTALKGEGFEKCVVGVFEKIEYLKPKTGRTMVSYSIRFTP